MRKENYERNRKFKERLEMLDNKCTNLWPDPWSLVQIGTFQRAITNFNTNINPNVNLTNGPWLDAGPKPSNWPYAFYISRNIAEDSPGQPCYPTMSNVYRSDVFQTILVYSNNTIKCMPVPLKIVNWSWSGSGYHNSIGTTNWILQNAMSNCSQAVDTFIHPQWTNYLDPGNIFFK
jgi:hypothetical protein